MSGRQGLRMAVVVAVGLWATAVMAGTGAEPAATGSEGAAARFLALDANHDGVLSRYEYDSEVVLEVTDSDHDGLLSAAELEAVLPAAAPASPSVAQRMLVADLDRDGKLNEDELQRALEARFDWLDRDHDGNLDRAEMAMGYGARSRP